MIRGYLQSVSNGTMATIRELWLKLNIALTYLFNLNPTYRPSNTTFNSSSVIRAYCKE